MWINRSFTACRHKQSNRTWLWLCGMTEAKPQELVKQLFVSKMFVSYLITGHWVLLFAVWINISFSIVSKPSSDFLAPPDKEYMTRDRILLTCWYTECCSLTAWWLIYTIILLYSSRLWVGKRKVLVNPYSRTKKMMDEENWKGRKI